MRKKLSKTMKRILSAVLVILMAISIAPLTGIGTMKASAANANDASIFLKQPVDNDGTCVFTSCLNMFRRRAIIDGVKNWESITHSNYRRITTNGKCVYCRIDDVLGMNAICTTNIGKSVSAKKTYFINMLASHPEGIVIYSGRNPQHTVLLTDYDSSSDTFYCVDPLNSYPKGRISLTASRIGKGSSQNNAIAKISQIWYITNRSGGSISGTTTPITEPSEPSKSSNYSIGNYTVKVNSYLNCRQNPTANSKSLYKLHNNDVVEVTATDGNWGYTKYGWICLDYTTYNTPISTPVFSQPNYDTGNYTVSTKAGLWVRGGAGKGRNIRALKYGTQFSVTDVDGSWGYSPEQDGWLCLNYAKRVSSLVPALPTPEAPTLTTTSSSEIGVGDIIQVKWNAVDYAESYTLNLIDKTSGSVVETKSGLTGTDTSFAVSYAGTFDISIVAVNSQHSSRISKIYGITAKAPSTVTFKDWDGKVLSSQKIAYSKDAILPQSPSRTGYTFNGWSGNYKTIREDSTVTATYTRNSYTVTFYDYDGVKVLNTQKVLYQDSAKAPSYSAPTGYTFVKWDKDFSSITSNTSVKAVIQWTSSYPLEIDTTSSIVRNNTAYITTAIVNNSPKAVSNAKVIVALKTAQGKQVAEVKSSNLSIAAGEVKTVNLSVTYDGAATIGNIFVVKADNENIPLAANLIVNVDQGTAWSGWSTSNPPSDALKKESRTEYRYRVKDFKTSTSSSLSGYTQYGTPTVSYSNWGGWSAWQDSAAYDSDLVNTRTQTVPSAYYLYSYNTMTTGGKRQFRNYSVNGDYSSYGLSKNYGEYFYSKADYCWASVDAINAASVVQPGEYASNCSYPGTNKGNQTGYILPLWPDTSNTYVVYLGEQITKVQYSYRTRTKTTTYYFYKWLDWSDWTTTSQTATDDKQVETRTTYRYISNNPKNIEDTSGMSRTISGSVDAKYAGKFALLHIYSADGATQFMGQTKLSSTGAYSYTFKLKNEPTAASGDYYVAMSIEGTTASFMLDPILAPLPVYTVTFKNYDGNIIETQQIKKGSNATMPNSPERTGYTFKGWSGTGTNIQEDTTITANFVIKTLDVVFVDDLNGTRQKVTFNYGDTLTVPTVANNEAYDFLGWDAVLNGITKVTENLVVNAKYQIKKFTVTFLDFEGNVMQTSTVDYGDGVVAPELKSGNGYIFRAWDNATDLGYITKDLTVKPYYEYENTVEKPTASIETGSFTSKQTVTLSCATQGAAIYYTTDGSDPLEEKTTSNSAKAMSLKAASVSPSTYNGKLYTGPFELDDSATLVYAAVKDGMNTSDFGVKVYSINTPSTIDDKYLVNVHDSLYDNEYSILVEKNNIVSLFDGNSNEYGYTLVGAYTDAAHTKKWNLDTDKVTESMDLYLVWEKNIYNVKFLDKDGKVLSEQSVAYMDSAKAPTLSEIDGYVLKGWSCDYSSIIGDTTVQAIYINRENLTEVTLSANELLLNSTNNTATLTATVKLGKGATDDQIIWRSSDDNVAIVDEMGNVTAVSDGTAIISAISEDSGMSATCKVTVSLNNAHEDDKNVSAVSIDDVNMNYKATQRITPNITANDGAKYTVTWLSSDEKVAKVDENGYVYAAKTGSATITCTVTDSNGNVVTDTSKVTVKYAFWQILIRIFLLGFLWY